MKRKLSWGILSTAKINDQVIGPLKQAKRSELVAVASRDLEKAKAYAQEKGITTVYGSYEELLVDPNIEVVYNPLPNSLHTLWTVKAANAGKHVLCEKPMAMTLEELDRIVEAAKENKVIVTEGYMYLHHPQSLRVKEMVEDGKIGSLQFINSWFTYNLLEESDNFRLNPELGGGSLWDAGVYPISLAVVMAQPSLPVRAYASQMVGETGVDVMMNGQIDFDSGVTAHLSTGFRSAFSRGVRIVGSDGMIFVNEPWKPQRSGHGTELVYSDQFGREELIHVEHSDPFGHEIRAMEKCILDGDEPVVPLSLSRGILRTVLGLYESAQTGRVVYFK